MRLCDFLDEMEKIAPKELAYDFDNPGLLITPESDEIKKVLLALDCTPDVAREAAETGCQLVLTHHPLFFQAVKRIDKNDPDTAAAWLLIRNGIGLFAAHANLDAAPGGVNDALLAALGIGEIRPLEGEPCGRVGKLPKLMPLGMFVDHVNEKLRTRAACIGTRNELVSTVACVSGSGGDCAEKAKAAGADVFLTGEMKHHEALAAEVLGIPCVVAGHYETERVVLGPLMDRLQNGKKDVQYNLALSDRGPFKRG